MATGLMRRFWIWALTKLAEKAPEPSEMDTVWIGTEHPFSIPIDPRPTEVPLTSDSTGVIEPKPLPVPPWLEIAMGELHVQEVEGSSHNPRILEYKGKPPLRAPPDEVPGCSAFACWGREQAVTPPTKSASARSWTVWGEESPAYKGAVCVLSRGNDPKKGHVGFYMGEEGDHILLLGGNQGNEVNISSYAKSRVVAYRTCQWGSA